MSSKKKLVLQPQYMKDFCCSGTKCEDSCCIGWRIDIDKETFIKYKKVQNRELKPIINKMVTRKRSKKNNEGYGRIKLCNNGRCPFLNENNLCNIYINIGEGYLSNACTYYPRIVSSVDGKIERSATMSCPEVAKLALLNPDGIIFEQVEDYGNITINNLINAESYKNTNKLERYFWDIRIFSLTLLQDRNYRLEERLIILGIVYKKIENLYKNNKMKEIPIMLENMNHAIQDGILKDDINRIPTNISIQLRLVKEMTDKKVLQGVDNGRYINCLRETLMGIGCVEEVNYEIMTQKYNENYSKFVQPYLKEKEYILENYLVNEFFKFCMPFGEFNSIWDSYVFLCVLYSMVKLNIIGISGCHNELNDEIMIKVIQSLSKEVLHNDPYIQGIVKLIKDNEFDSLAYMSVLVKN